jgi:putative oxidoreductase
MTKGVVFVRKMKTMKISSHVAAAVAAIILLQTLYFKFTAAPESVYIFSTIGIEPWGRIATGIAELIAGILILLPATRVYGALFSLGIISGAIFSHLFILGIAVENDGGQLFLLAVIVFVSSMIVTILHRKEIPFLGKYL